jgi:hypothetical protein
MGSSAELGYFVADGIGLFGAALIVLAYFLLQTGRLDSLSLSFSIINALGASGILFSLFFEFNLSAFAIESFWLVISLYGIYRAMRVRNSLSTSASNIGDRRV